MKRPISKLISGLVASVLGMASVQTAMAANVTVQAPGNVVGTGDKAWSYLIVEGEDYDTESNDAAGMGFTRANNSGTVTNALGNPVLAKNTTASKKGALWTQTVFSQHADKVTYNVQFSKAGTYYLYMRFTMFENGGNLANYLNEDSFFLPPDFGKDPQTDWPLSDRGGYAEGCCDGGFLTIKEGGTPVTHNLGDDAGRAYWEGNFHWNELSTSQFLNPETQGVPRARFKYEVKESQVGKPLPFTVSYREGGVTIDLWLFSTNPNLMDEFTQAGLDQTLIPEAAGKVTVQAPTNVVGTGDKAWSYLIVEGEDYDTKSNDSPGVGFARANNSGTVTNALGNPVLAKNTTASKKGALWTQTVFSQHADKVTYNVQFSKAGTYYLYMRFTMFENGGNLAHYLNEDSFFLPPDFGKDPQTDWPLSDRGGYAEGCCDGGFLTIKEGGNPVSHSTGDDAGRAYWEGNFHWNELSTSQFLNPETQGVPRSRFKYEVKESQVGKPLPFTVSYREGGVTIDLWLFSTNPNLMDEFTQAGLDQTLIPEAAGKVTVQAPTNVVGTGAKAWSYLIVEGEDYDTESNDAAGMGFTRADNSGTVTNALGNPVLAKNTTASKKGALWTQTVFSQHADKVTYNVQFSKAGTYYLYMRFTMFENGGNLAHYLNEDSFFLPPDFGKDPQTDWPLSDRGGYAEGCCDGGFLTIKEGGNPVSHSTGDDAGRAYWEGNFHWNELSTSQFLNPETQGVPRARFKYEVKESQVGKPLPFTVSYREGGLAVDLWLFSTNPDLMDQFTQDGLDQLLINPLPKLAASRSGSNALLSWPTAASGFVLESASTLSPANWTVVTTAPAVAGGQNTVTVDAASGSRFYRLRKL